MGTAALAALLLTLAILAIFTAVNTLTKPDDQLRDRLESMTLPSPEDEQPKGLTKRLSLGLGNMANRSDSGSKIAGQLAKANVSLTVGEFMLMRYALVLIAFGLGWFFAGQILAGAAIGLLASFLPNWYLKRLHTKRQELFQEQLPDVLMLMVSSLQAGHGLVQAMNLVTQEMPPPSKEEFNRVVKEIALGISAEDALQHLVERIGSDDLDLVVTAINIQREVGGNLAAILSTIIETIRERVRIQGEIRVMTSQQRATGMMLSGMPFILGGIIMMINTDYMMGLFDREFICMPIGAVVMMVVGQIVMRKMLDFDY